MKNHFLALTGVVFSLWLGIGSGAPPEVRFDRISMAQGLSQSSIQAIAQCSDGFMWFGTQFGLDRYDGYEFSTLRHDPDDQASLSNNYIHDLLLARSGHIWVANRGGLDRLDTRTRQVERFAVPGLAANQTASLRIHFETEDQRVFLDNRGGVMVWQPELARLVEVPFEHPMDPALASRRSAVLDQQGRFWLFNGAGLWRKDSQRGQMVLEWALSVPPEHPFYRALALAPNGMLAVAQEDALVLIDPETAETVFRRETGWPDQRLNAVIADSRGRLWLAQTTRLIRFNLAEDDWQVVFDGDRIRTDVETPQRIDMIEDHRGDLWFTSQFGVARWHAPSDQAQVLSHDPANPYSIPPSSVRAGYSAYVDNEGTVWVGSRLGGLGRYSALKRRFEAIRDTRSPGAAAYAGLNVVRALAEDSMDGHEYLWVALDHGGVRRLRRLPGGRYEVIQTFHRRSPQERRLLGDSIWGVVADPQSDLVWILESHHLVAVDAGQDRVVGQWPLFDSPGRRRNTALRLSADENALWVGQSDGLVRVLIGEDRLTLQPETDRRRLQDRWVFNLLVGDDNRVLAGAQGGVGLVDGNNADNEQFFPLEAGSDELRVDVYGLAAHPDSGWWLGTRDHGLLHFDPEGSGGDPASRWYRRQDGLIDDTIYAILAQADGQLWMSSNRGLMRWSSDTGDVRHFTPADGIQGFEFNHGVAHVGPSGRHYFGGVHGVNGFFPEQVADFTHPPRLHLRQLNVRGQAVEPIRGGPTRVVLSHAENDLELQFVGLMFSDPQRVRYAYQLEGIDEDWVDAGRQRQVRYAGLRAGTYRFHARAANSDGYWSDDQLLLEAIIRPPPWQSRPAYLIYGLIMAGLLGLFYTLQAQRRHELEVQVRRRTAELSEQQDLVRRQAGQLREALEARTRFFANVSHEFRTPLTLIDASLEKLRNEGGDAITVNRGRHYLRQTLRLVEQLLNLSSLQVDQSNLHEPPWSLAPVIAGTVEAFRPLSKKRGIELLTSIEEGWATTCSQEYVEKIVLNLISNALKFCPKGCQIRIGLRGAEGEAMIEVADTGPGIEPAEQRLIFERFYRAEAAGRGRVAGAGIGLALVREATEAMGGRVELDSQPKQGSAFRIYLPASKAEVEPASRGLLSTAMLKLDAALLDDSVSNWGDDAEVGPVDDQAARILVVEDSPDLRHHLSRILGQTWQVMVAEDGEEGLKLARRERPGLIVADIMMPRMDGFELLRALRQDLETSHIPVLLLTARQDRDTRLKGLSLSADDFLAKPFDAAELVIRIRRMLDNRDRQRQQLLATIGRQVERTEDLAEGADLAQRDGELMRSLNAWLAEHHVNPDIKVRDLASAVALEERTLQRKLRALVGLTPAAFVRDFRLQQAARLLRDSELTVGEIALSCGFSTPQAFHRQFRRKYGTTPDSWRS